MSAKAGTLTHFGFKIRDIILLSLVLQTTGIVLLMRYSKVRPQPPEGSYRATAAVLCAELLKLPFCLTMAGWTLGGVQQLQALLASELWTWSTLKCAVPAVAFTLQSNLLFVALTNLDPPTYQVTYQSKTVFTAVFSVLMLGRRLKRSQWLALLLLCTGGVLVSDMRGSSRAASTGGSFVRGICSVLAAAVLSSSSSVY